MAITDDFRDLVRLLIGDTAGDLLDDDQLDLLIGSETSAYLAGALAADALAARFSRSVTFSVEGLTIQNSSKAMNYLNLATRLRITAANSDVNSIGAVAMGTSKGEMTGVAEDTDRERSRFSIGQHDYPGAQQSKQTD